MPNSVVDRGAPPINWLSVGHLKRFTGICEPTHGKSHRTPNGLWLCESWWLHSRGIALTASQGSSTMARYSGTKSLRALLNVR